ncbi:hypothetical protein CCH79_00014289 [Gambusia affinis]|uniref:Anaphylatoxin-like domain-containing protein n=1 Tax=Gambusia affinis TaxID=33528 RepID=A0A315UT84_GAMAF|nr:hypothetical protein CCH79_00014289 [Gambusia affinis]
MRRALLLLLASLAFASLADGANYKVMSSPNLMRVGTAESIFVECQDCTGGDMVVSINVMNHPAKNKKLTGTSVTLNAANNYQGLGKVTMPVGEFRKDPTAKQYVYVQAQFPDRLLEKVVLVSFQSGYIFIQTDKTLYTPDSKVYYRIFALTPQMEPVERNDQNQVDASVDIEIVTPEDIIIPLDSVALNGGMFSGDYKLAEIVSPGLWQVVAKFKSNPQQKYNASFEVKEYVLPSFEVKLLPVVPFFYVNSEELVINIKAKYLFGKDVDGTAYVVFGIMDGNVKKSLPHSLTRVPVTKGEGQAILKKDQITQTFNINDQVGKAIFVSVSVLTESGSEMVEAEIRGIQIVTSPYKIIFTRTPKFFKPGMSFDVAVEVINPDDSPANGIPVVISPGNVRGITASNGMARLTINTAATDSTLKIIAKTERPDLRADRQATAEMTAAPYTTNSKTYIHISIDTAEVKVGDNLKINLNLNKPPQEKDITYLILSRGQLLKSERYRTRGQGLISLILPITKEMLPSFRIVAYYHPTDNEVVSDSVWVDVTDSCMGSLTLESKRPLPSYEPRRMFTLKVTGDPGATVGLVAVDKGVYVLNNKHRLTQKKVWDEVEHHDIGCTPGGGSNGMNVFFDAGLVFESSTASGTAYRQEKGCRVSAKRKRSTTIMEVRTTLLSQFANELERECCLDGMKETPLSYTCEERKAYIVDGEACANAFLQCCTTIKTQLSERREENLQLARSKKWEPIGREQYSFFSKRNVNDPMCNNTLGESDDSYMDSNEIVSRTKFPESWLWIDIQLPRCPANAQKCEAVSVERNVPLQDSITTWEFTGISLSRTLGICVGKPLEVIVHKEFFIDLRLPYSAVRGEQLEIKAILHNYSPEQITVRVELIEEENVCSVASKRGKYRQEVRVGPETTRSVPFIIIPMKEGQRRIEVKAAVKDSSLNDGVMKMLRVVPEGVLVKTAQIVSLDPVKKAQGGAQVEILNSNIPRKDLIPNAPTSTQVSVTGREQMVSWYYAVPKENENGCQKFNLSVHLIPEILDEDRKTYRLRIDVLYKDRDQDATMSILNIGLLTGFTVDTQDLDLLSRGHGRTVARYEMNTVLSESSSLIIYLDKVSHTQPEEISFRIHQRLKFAVSQPAAVSVYEYYDQAPCVKFYHPERQNMKLCKNDECICVEETCNMQKRYRSSTDERTDKICESTETSRTDFAYKATVEETEFESSADSYIMRIVMVIKEGPTDTNVQGKLRTFLSHQHCRHALNLEKGKTYLIMGSSKDIYRDDQNHMFLYVLGERPWIEYWPSAAECQTEEHRSTCEGMEEMIDQNTDHAMYIGESDDSYMDSADIFSRTKFPERWLESTSFEKNFQLGDSITTSQITGISLSRTLGEESSVFPSRLNFSAPYFLSHFFFAFSHPKGICVGEPLEVIVHKEFFIDLQVPYSAVRGEQLEIKAILHNYSPEPITVRVELIKEENVCSVASKRGKYRQEVRIGPETTRSVPFIIIPMKEGQHNIEVKASVRDSSLNDGIIKMLRVVVLALRYVMSAPNLLRIGTEERIFIEIQDNVNPNGDVTVPIRVMKHPTKDSTYASTSVTLTDRTHFQAFAKIVIPPDTFDNDRNGKHYVTLQAQFPDRLLEKVVLVSFQSGFIFIQTDKPIYTPSSSVRFRIFPMWPDMQSQSNTSINFEIVTPVGIVIESKIISLKNLASGIYSAEYRLGNIVSFGNWRIVANFHSKAAESFTTEFESIYFKLFHTPKMLSCFAVLPSFEVKLLLPPKTPFFYVDSSSLNITIQATYTFGREVDGTAYVVFGLMNGDEKKSFPSSLQRVRIQNGNGMVTLWKKHITKTYENILNLVGRSMYVSVSVLTESGSEMVEAELRGIQIVQSPYTIRFKRTPKYFKPGMSFDITVKYNYPIDKENIVEVLNPDGSPAVGIPVSVTCSDECAGQSTGLLATTESNGMARLSVNTVAELQRLQITANTNYPENEPNRQARATMVALPYKSSSNSLLRLSVFQAEVELGKSMKVDFYFSKPESQENDITYLILSRGQLLQHFREKKFNQNQISVTVDVTKEMLPSFRIVAYYHTSSNELVSDSVWVDVTDTCMGKAFQEAKPIVRWLSQQQIYSGGYGSTQATIMVYQAVAEYASNVTEPPFNLNVDISIKGRSLMNKINLNNQNHYTTRTSKKPISVVVEGDLGATVGMVAVDNAVYILNNKNRLTQKKIWDVVEQYDTGCTAGGGKDGKNVFYDAGLLFESSYGGTPSRTDFKCPTATRRKRERTIMEVRTSLLSDFKDHLQKDCCLDGMKEIPVSYTCERRTEYIMDGPECKQAFLLCCNEMRKQRDERKVEILHLARSEKDDYKVSRDEITSRSKFPESWFWSDIPLKSCPENDPKCTTVSAEIRQALPDTITTWQLTAISMSKTHGLCVAKPLQIITWKPFFIDLRLPYSAVQGEQLEIRAILHNYNDYSITVRLEFKEEASICSAAYKKKWFQNEFRVGSQTTRAVPFIIIPMKHGSFPIEVKAAVKDSYHSDGVRKMLLVVPQGVLMKEQTRQILNPARKAIFMHMVPDVLLFPVIGGRQEEIIKSNISMAHLVPNTPKTTLISLTEMPMLFFNDNPDHCAFVNTGIGQMNTLLDNVISGKSVSDLIRAPHGCGEQNMARMTLPVIAALYLDKTNQWESVGFEKRNEAIQHIQTGYQTQFKFRKGDGSFAIFPDQPSTTWLTAYVAKVFAMATPYMYIESHMICGAIKFLILKTQRPDGMFVEVGEVWTKSMIGDVGGVDSDASMTAFCLISMKESSEMCSDYVPTLSNSMTKAQAYLEQRLPRLTNPYAVALTSYALANFKKLDRNVLFKHAAQDRTHWPVQKGKDATLEATAYALLALVKDQMVSLYYAIPTKKESDCEMYKNMERNASMSILDIGLPTGYKFNKNDLDALSKGRDRIIDDYEADKELSEKGSLIIYLKMVPNSRPEEISFRIEQSMPVGFLQPAAVSVYEYYETASEKRCVKFYRPQRESGELLRLCEGEACLCAEENCSKQRKEGLSNDNRLAKACESSESSKIDFVYKVVVEDFSGNYTSDSYTVRILQTYKKGTTDESPQGKYRTFLSYKHCREALDLKPSKTYLIMGSSSDIHIVGTSYRYIIGETTWVEYWPTTEECQTDIHYSVCSDLENMEDQLLHFGLNMGSECRMKRTQPWWLFTSVAFISVISRTTASPILARQNFKLSFSSCPVLLCRKVMSAPNLLRVGRPQNIFVECQDCPSEENFTVSISVMNWPTRSKRLAHTSVNLNAANRFQAFGEVVVMLKLGFTSNICRFNSQKFANETFSATFKRPILTIPADELIRSPNIKHYVYLQAQFPDVKLEKIVLLSLHAGYIFIQTDKALYTPNSKVLYRIFAMTPDMKPVERDNMTQMDASVAIEFVTPEGVILPLDPVALRSGIHSGDFQLAEVVSVGLWKIVARFQSIPQMSYSAEFEIKEYVLPSFDVKLIRRSSFFFSDTRELHVDVKATYMFGEDVQGSAYGVFGVVLQNQKKSFPSSLQRVPIEEGEGVVTLKREHVAQTFENFTDLMGSSIFVAVSVLTSDGSEMVEAELRDIYIVISPYIIQFTKTPKYFKPGLSFDFAVEVLNPDGTSAQGVPVAIDEAEVEGVTSANGMARLSVNTLENAGPLKITVRTKNPRISDVQQASASMTALPYRLTSKNYVHIGKY